MKRITQVSAIFFVVMLIYIFSPSPNAYGSAIGINIDGKSILFTQNSGSPFIDSASRTQVPLRITMEAYGCSVDWNSAERIAIVKKDGMTVEVPIGQSYILVNNVKRSNDTAALIKDNRTYLPLRAVLEAFGATVNWNKIAYCVDVTTGPVGNAADFIVTPSSDSPVTSLVETAIIAPGRHLTLVVKTDGSLWEWGTFYYEMFANSKEKNESHFTPINVMNNVSTAAVGYGHCLALKTDGSLWTWGMNCDGQLGDGTINNRSVPVKVMDNVATVVAGDYCTFVIKDDNSLWGWGSNYSGEIGDGTTINRSVPLKIMDNVATVVTGDYNSVFAIKTDKSLWGWGNNECGNIGDGTVVNKLKPVKIMDNVVSVSATVTHTMGIKTDGSLWAWGSNRRGAIGDGTVDQKLKPVKVMDNVRFVVAENNRTLAIKTDGSLWQWGAQFNGGIGLIGEDAIVVPQKKLNDVASVSINGQSFFALKKDGSLWAWGRNDRGQLGAGGIFTDKQTFNPFYPIETVSTPIKILEKVYYISPRSTFVIRTDGSLWAWGINDYGQLGNGKASILDVNYEGEMAPIKVMDLISLGQ